MRMLKLEIRRILQLEENIADTMEDIATSVATTYHNVEDAVISYDIPSKAAIARDAITKASSNIKSTAWELVQSY